MADDFPYLGENDEIQFPLPEEASPEGIVASGGNLSPGCLLSAYKQGIFPWFSEGDPILWWSPDPRFVLKPEALHVSKSMKKLLKKNDFQISFDRDFKNVIKNCSVIKREAQPGTWITDDMVNAYIKLHELGWAHSVEVWKDNELAGGLYGISIGRCFAGESMFSNVSNASKFALIKLVEYIIKRNYVFVDCQVFSDHLSTMGAEEISRKEFLKLLDISFKDCDLKNNWK